MTDEKPRLTITMEQDLIDKIRNRQAQEIKQYKKSVSFSAIVGKLCWLGLKNNAS